MTSGMAMEKCIGLMDPYTEAIGNMEFKMDWASWYFQMDLKE